MRTIAATLITVVLIAVISFGCGTSGAGSDQDSTAATVESSSSPSSSSEQIYNEEAATKTMRSMRIIATTCETYAIDWGYYPTANSISELAELVAPTYVKVLPEADAWGNPFEVSVSKKGYEIRSLGRDGLSDIEPRSGITGDFDADIVFSDELRFLQSPIDG